MNHERAFVPASAVMAHVAVARYDALRARLTALVALWREHAARRRELRDFDAVVGGNIHMLKDIGAPCWMIARAALRNESADPWLAQIGGAP